MGSWLRWRCAPWIKVEVTSCSLVLLVSWSEGRQNRIFSWKDRNSNKYKFVIWMPEIFTTAMKASFCVCICVRACVCVHAHVCVVFITVCDFPIERQNWAIKIWSKDQMRKTAVRVNSCQAQHFFVVVWVRFHDNGVKVQIHEQMEIWNSGILMVNCQVNKADFPFHHLCRAQKNWSSSVLFCLRMTARWCHTQRVKRY